MKIANITKILLSAGILIFGLWAWFLTPPWEFSQPSWRLFLLFLCAIFAVLTQVLSIFLASIIAMVIAVSSGILSPEKAFSGFSESFMILILSSFLVAKAIIHSGLGQKDCPGFYQAIWSFHLKIRLLYNDDGCVNRPCHTK